MVRRCCSSSVRLHTVLFCPHWKLTWRLSGLNRMIRWIPLGLTHDGTLSVHYTTTFWEHFPWCEPRAAFSFQYFVQLTHRDCVGSHATLSLTKVNTFGLVYVWSGSDTSLKPILLAAHQGGCGDISSASRIQITVMEDVVPVDPTTVDQWLYPPYSGYFDGRNQARSLHNYH